MKQLFKTVTAFCLATVMACSMIAVAAAQKVATDEDNTEIIVSINDDGSKAYTLVWKYKTLNGHLYKRRWNKTLNCWYDPDWILVQ